eukprot:scaffold12507_cov34-Cyclotella_meneghiniana.AAC.3
MVNGQWSVDNKNTICVDLCRSSIISFLQEELQISSECSGLWSGFNPKRQDRKQQLPAHFACTGMRMRSHSAKACETRIGVFTRTETQEDISHHSRDVLVVDSSSYFSQGVSESRFNLESPAYILSQSHVIPLLWLGVENPRPMRKETECCVLSQVGSSEDRLVTNHIVQPPNHNQPL